MIERALVAHPRSGSTWVRNLLAADPKRAGRFEFTHLGMRITEDGEVYRLPVVSKKIAGKRVALLVRDPRDIAISLWYFCRYRCKNTRIDLRSFFMAELTYTVRYYDDVIALRDDVESMEVFYYEAFLEDPERRLVELCDFFEFPPGDPRSAVEEYSFKKMQEKDQSRVYRLHGKSNHWDGDTRSLMAREGRVGAWREKFEGVDLPEIWDWLLYDTGVTK